MTEPIVELRRVSKHFGAFAALDDVSLSVAPAEFITILGPSGSGKTTALRLIAGFEQPTSGEIWMGGRSIHLLPPYKREVNTVFQNYALFPHMSVWDNVAYGLKMRRVPKVEIGKRVGEALELVHLEQLTHRAPRQLSGGQQQRVALARALVNRPKLLLLDEPLGALDLKLRKEMQLELKHLQTQVGITFLYVTHDQEEALTMSDRVALMQAGRIEQLGTPQDIYDRPASRFVADFIGETNLLLGRLHELSDGAALVDVEGQLLRVHPPADAAVGQALWVSVRPELIAILADGQAPPGYNVIEGLVEDGIYAGSLTKLRLRLPGGSALVVHAAPTDAVVAPGSRLRVGWPVGRGVSLAS